MTSQPPPPLPTDMSPTDAMTGATETTTTVDYDAEAFADALDDVHTRFVLNLPPEELASPVRLLFQIEQAWWFYEDMICDPQEEKDPATIGKLPRYSTMYPFSVELFQFSPLLDPQQFPTMWNEYRNYKKKISTFGMILLNADVTQMILVQTWDGKTWTLPAGKINQGERGVDAAVRECYEETGFDPHCEFGMTKEWAESPTSCHKITWSHPLPEANALSYQENNGKRRTCYVCVGVPMDFDFRPVARKEVSEVSWFDLDALPKKTYAVWPLVSKLRSWIKKYKKKKRANKRSKSNSRDKSAGRDKSNTKQRAGSTGKQRRRRSGSGGGSSKLRTIQNTEDPLVDAGLANVGEVARWSEDDMFKANEELLGRKVDYDGNPHMFSEQGFAGNDPHAFRVVGGSLMNSGDGLSHITDKKEQASKYQPLVNMSAGKDDLPLTPFFTQDGATPWGEVVAEAKSSEAAMQKTEQEKSNEQLGDALLAMLQRPPEVTKPDSTSDPTDVFTDAQITARSQERAMTQKPVNTKLREQYQQDMKFIQEWAAKLPNPIQFRIENVDAILQQHFG